MSLQTFTDACGSRQFAGACMWRAETCVFRIAAFQMVGKAMAAGYFSSGAFED